METNAFHAGGFLYNPKTNSVLLHKRDGNTTNNPNKWAFFGGASEGDETPKQTLIREMREELSISVRDEEIIALASYFNDKFNRHRYSFFVKSEMQKDQMKLSEGADFDWIPLGKVFEYDLTEFTRKDLETFVSMVK